MKRQRLYLDENGKGTVFCPECHSSHEADFSSFKGSQQLVKVKCPCGPVKEVEIEFRKNFRKNTKLFGRFVKHGTPEEKGTMMVGNLSFSGIGFTVYGAHSLQVGDRLTVNFALDDQAKSRIEKSAEVRNVSGKTIGAKFIQPAGATDPNLGFYLKDTAPKSKSAGAEDINWID